MDKKYFVLKLIPARADFAQTMSGEERQIMLAHVNYWRPYLEQGLMQVMGPVMDPAMVYGLGIVAVDSEDELKPLLENDPASAINRYEYYPIKAVLGKRI